MRFHFSTRTGMFQHAPSCTLPISSLEEEQWGISTFFPLPPFFLFLDLQIPIPTDLDHPCIRMIIASSLRQSLTERSCTLA